MKELTYCRQEHDGYFTVKEGMEGRGEKVREVIMDGGYDRGEVWRETERRGAKGGIKVRREGF